MNQFYAKTYGNVYGTEAGSIGLHAETRIFYFPTPDTTWVITHNLGTEDFTASLFDANNHPMIAATKAVNKNQIVVYLTTPTSGKVNITFSLA
jgi:hypothetical protein